MSKSVAVSALLILAAFLFGPCCMPHAQAQTIYISTLQQLQEMNLDLDADYILLNDIDASATAGWNSGEGFEPIGTETTAFAGTFDGRGHVITGLTINRSEFYIGLFGYSDSSARIRNVGLVQCNVKGVARMGGLIGRNYGKVSNCYSTGTVSGVASPVGGLVGSNLDPGIISNCYSTVAVTCSSTVGAGGGLVGGNSGSVSNCYSTGTVSAYAYTGGLVGYNIGSISNCYSNGAVSGYGAMGGLVGQNDGLLTKCYSTGSVSAHEEAGGLVGYNLGSVSNCYSTGAVSGTGNNIGGLVGLIEEEGTIDNCYSTGEVSGNSNVGGLAGLSSGAINNSYWDMQTSGQNTSGGGEVKTTEEMMQQATFVDWDFEEVWTICEGTTYPCLKRFPFRCLGCLIEINPEAKATSVPTLNQWGLIIFGILLAGSAVWFISYRKGKS